MKLHITIFNELAIELHKVNYSIVFHMYADDVYVTENVTPYIGEYL